MTDEVQQSEENINILYIFIRKQVKALCSQKRY